MFSTRLALGLPSQSERYHLPVHGNPIMSVKRKPATIKKEWQSTRELYTWHLRPPFDKLFDRTHWWHEQQADPASALYEIARRHPTVGELRMRVLDTLTLARTAGVDYWQHCLWCIGLAPWSKLSEDDRGYWESAAGAIKGVDCRDEDGKCVYLGSSELAVTCGVREGWHTFAVAPDLPFDEASRLLAKHYREACRGRPALPKKKTKNNESGGWIWLHAVAEFEADFARYGEPKSGQFNRYRRILDGIIGLKGSIGAVQPDDKHLGLSPRLQASLPAESE